MNVTRSARRLVCVTTIAVGVFAGVAGTSGQAGASAAVSGAHSVPWAARTCGAFAVWERHPTPGHLVTLGTDGLRVPWKYLGGDVWQLVNDVHAQPKYVSDDETYIWEDCHNGSGL